MRRAKAAQSRVAPSPEAGRRARRSRTKRFSSGTPPQFGNVSAALVAGAGTEPHRNLACAAADRRDEQLLAVLGEADFVGYGCHRRAAEAARIPNRRRDGNDVLMRVADLDGIARGAKPAYFGEDAVERCR